MKIKKCPFCGSKHCCTTSERISENLFERFVKCTFCESRGPSSYNKGDEAIILWNAAPRKKRKKRKEEEYHSFCAFCAIHGIALQHVRPGKWQCAECEGEDIDNVK